MHIEAIDLTDVIVSRSWAEVDEPDDFSGFFCHQQFPPQCWIADEIDPHTTAEFHGSFKLGGGKQLVVANSPSLRVCVTNAVGVIRNGLADDGHIQMMPRGKREALR